MYMVKEPEIGKLILSLPTVNKENNALNEVHIPLYYKELPLYILTYPYISII
jgi:hypothetical protein